MAVAGFSINLITLFALVLVIGTVVDDSIVVVEAVQARFDVGYQSPYMASIDKIMLRIGERLRQVPKLHNLMATSGYSLIGGQGTAAGMFIVRLEDWDERT